VSVNSISLLSGYAGHTGKNSGNTKYQHRKDEAYNHPGHLRMMQHKIADGFGVQE
jgi:hypothetical protein